MGGRRNDAELGFEEGEFDFEFVDPILQSSDLAIHQDNVRP